MSTIKKILVPLDFSEGSIAAQRQAEMLARTLGAELLLVHVIDETPYMLVDGAGYLPARAIEELERLSTEKLKSAVAEATKAGLSVQRGLLRHGRPGEAIVSAAKEHGADLIVMSTHGRHGLPHLLLGSVAERVVRTSTIPVMTLRAGTAQR